MAKSFHIKIDYDIDYESVATLLHYAFSRGDCKWARVTDHKHPTRWTYNSPFPRDEEEDMTDTAFTVDFPLNPGGSLTITDITDKEKPVEHTLDMAAVERGLVALAEYPDSFVDVITGKFESEDLEEYQGVIGDIFLQCCIFGEIKYK